MHAVEVEVEEDVGIYQTPANQFQLLLWLQTQWVGDLCPVAYQYMPCEKIPMVKRTEKMFVYELVIIYL